MPVKSYSFAKTSPTIVRRNPLKGKRLLPQSPMPTNPNPFRPQVPNLGGMPGAPVMPMSGPPTQPMGPGAPGAMPTGMPGGMDVQALLKMMGR